MLEKLQANLKEHRKEVDVISIFLITIVLMINMFKTNTDIYLDDGSQHLMRSFWTYKNILQNGSGNIISDFSNGFGYSWNLFYGPLSAYVIILFGVIFGSFNFGFKLTLLSVVFFAGFFMYKLIIGITQKNNTALLGAIIYITSPYFFTDIYIRHSVGECFGFVFIPLVFLGLYNLFNTEENHYYLVFGACRFNFVT